LTAICLGPALRPSITCSRPLCSLPAALDGPPCCCLTLLLMRFAETRLRRVQYCYQYCGGLLPRHFTFAEQLQELPGCMLSVALSVLTGLAARPGCYPASCPAEPGLSSLSSSLDKPKAAAWFIAWEPLTNLASDLRSAISGSH